ncbi:ribonucleotide reductase inhibitor [Trichoderma guizhouense]|uniref:Ribonucleotide reductase inhibitor n=1 Tax=Trichoderma guizhouense TaxID=1491466 RepID=A0A1T3CW65_9HYPO|nr:ribonucleotide reductase inhibitor [Trichoderma guizhouense]
MSNPRTKRQFAGAAADPAQRQITSFFTGSPNNTSHPATPQPTLRPELPANVQANLLSVGMRVRKSVPEGYKTIDLAKTSSSPNSIATKGLRRSAVVAKQVPNELLPFCGINKVGGLDTQPESQFFDEDVPALDNVPELSMSQESMDSVVDGESSRKRTFYEESPWDIQASEAEYTQPHWNDRPIAVPHSRVKKAFAPSGFEEENMAVDGDEDQDFPDADFLVYASEQ